ncbi:hypothetical protein BM221_003692 [Beauveria bassiana]|uniref:Uncharacterized protein n=1 Tax=Beauveria bassiana TaxID=176275 RepID=A0A2N6NVC5_BEABA|nr:hypothetical protein BM221_003692 [Beauveria bassiana]
MTGVAQWPNGRAPVSGRGPVTSEWVRAEMLLAPSHTDDAGQQWRGVGCLVQVFPQIFFGVVSSL